MAKLKGTFLKIRKGFKSAEAASFVGQLDDQLRVWRADMQGISVAELEWQPKKGMNTIGMLTAHNAVVEVYWILVGLGGLTGPLRDVDSRPVLGIGMEDDGMPVPATGGHPRVLKGKSLDFYADLLERARTHSVKRLKPLTDADLSRRFVRTRGNGELWETDIRWMLYHLVEHFATHLGQMDLLRHQYRDRRRP